MNECDFNSTKASADSEERSVSTGRQRFHLSPGQEDMKVRQGQIDSYYERFCETVEMGLPDRVIDLDGWVRNMRNMRRIARKRRWLDMKLRSNQRLMDMKKQYWEFCSQARCTVC